jgi:LPS sulfotransferase NodH
MAPYTSEARHVVLGGAPRSGTTLLRKLLDRHPELCSGPETKLFVPAAFNLAWLAESHAVARADLEAMLHASASQGAFIDAFAARVTSAAGKARWAEKTPQNIRYLDWILARFPSASVIHIVRDGRDVVCSMREHPDWRWVDGAWQKVLVRRPVEWYAQRWLHDTAAGMAWRQDPRYVEVRYEDLVADPASAMGAICHAIGAVADAAWLADVARGATNERAAETNERAAHQPTAAADLTEGHVAAPDARRPDYGGEVSAISVGRWRTDLDAADQGVVTRICGSRLRELGYDD